MRVSWLNSIDYSNEYSIWWVGWLTPNNYCDSIFVKQLISRAGWLNSHCRIIVEKSITRIINHASWLIELYWLLELIINVTINHCRMVNHAGWLINQSLSNHCWNINHTNNQSCELVDWTRLTTRMNNQCDNQSLSHSQSRELVD